MPNPFETLGGTKPKPKKEPVQAWEAVQGNMTCQHYPCQEHAYEARYYQSAKRLEYEAKCGHKSIIEDFKL